MTKANRDAIKAAAYTALWTFLGMFGAAAIGWLNDVQKWATSDGAVTVFPDPSVLVKAGIAATAAGFAFVVAAIVRLAQANGLLPGQPPAYVEKPKGEGGQSVVGILLVVLLVIAIVVVARQL